MWAAHETEGQLVVPRVNGEKSHRSMRGTYIQSPNLKLAFGLGGLLDSTNVPDSRCIGATRSGSGENAEGGGKEMTGEFISRENGDFGEREKSDYDGRTLGTLNNGLRADIYAPGAAQRGCVVAWRMVGGRRRGRERSWSGGWWLGNKELRTPENNGEPQGRVSHRSIKRSRREINEKDATSVLWERLWLCTQHFAR